jgi:hypothetical protein
VKNLIVMAMVMALSGCPVRVDPPTSSACAAKPNCGQCASLPVCGWCPASRECLPADVPQDCILATAEPLCPVDDSGRRP